MLTRRVGILFVCLCVCFCGFAYLFCVLNAQKVTGVLPHLGGIQVSATLQEKQDFHKVGNKIVIFTDTLTALKIHNLYVESTISFEVMYYDATQKMELIVEDFKIAPQETIFIEIKKGYSSISISGFKIKAPQ